MSLPSRVALITGATSGIGKACATLFASNGFKVALTGRNESALEDIVGAIRQDGGDAQGFAGDVTNDEHCKDVVRSTISEFGGLDVLVNSAGVLKGGSADATSMETFDFNFNVNCRAVFSMMNESIPYLKESNGGAIVNVSSVNGMQSFAGTMAYCASKSAVDMITKCAAVDLAPHKIRVNSVNPGVVVTSLQKTGGLDDDAYEAFLERSKTVTHPLGRVAEANEIAQAILFLSLEDQSGFITGANLPIDGGRGCLGAR